MADDATRSDGAGPPPGWTPRKGKVAAYGQAISAGDRIGRPLWTEDLRRYNQGDGDKLVGTAEESVLPGWKIRERAPERWVADTDEGN